MKKRIQGFLQYRYLLAELVKKGIKLKYRRSYLGIIWTLIEPLLTMIVLTIVFGTLLGRGDRTFPVYVLSGRLLYSMFSTSTKTAMRAIRSNAGMIKKVYVPKYLYPLSGVLYNYVMFLLSLVVLLAVSVALGVHPNVYTFQAVVPLVTIFLLSLGVGMILATFSVFFRDLEYLWDVALMLIMYTSAIFYFPEKLLQSGYGFILRYNPLFCVIQSFRAAIYGQPMDMGNVVYALGFSLVALAAGFWAFYQKQDQYVLYI